MPSSPDQIRTAIRRYLASRAAMDDATLAYKTATERMNVATIDFNSATRDLAAVTGDAGFVYDGKLVRVSLPVGLGMAAMPLVTVCPFANLDVLDPPVVPAPPPVVAPVTPAKITPALKAGTVPPGIPVREGK